MDDYLMAKRIKEELNNQMKIKFKNNIYYFSQIRFAYNSNHMEGSLLTEDETRMIYETKSFFASTGKQVRFDDYVETVNHFRLFDYMLNHCDDAISIEMIFEMHKILKRGTSEEDIPKYNVGGFKIEPNVIGSYFQVKTTAPKNVEKEMNELIDSYNTKQQHSFGELIDFHYRFEKIHPFSDGNGRIGRMLLFKECLANDIIPFIILEEYKSYYSNGLKKYEDDSAYLIDTCLMQQDIYKEVCENLIDFGKEEEYILK